MFARSVLIGVVHVLVLSVLLSPASAGLVGSHEVHPVAVGTSPIPTTSAGAAAVRSPTITHASGPAPTQRLSTEARILDAIHASGVPSKDVYLPNFNAEPTRNGNVIGPTYLHSPAPIGIAAMGVENTTGNATGYVLNSPSYEGQITFNGLNEFYLDDDSTDYIGAQLNTVVANITLFGQTNYSFWNQNVITYSARSNLLQFIDNIWNFSSPAFYMSPNVFNSTSPNGNLIAPSFYYGLGPVINITMPFTVSLYINASTTNVNGSPDDIVWFNYSVVKSGASVASGTYDWAIFNSQDPAHLLPSIPAPMYQVNGINLSPTGYLPYDAELVLCGPGGGSTTSVYNIDATMNLWYLNTSTGLYQNVPSAFAYGTNTGETIEGATEWWDGTDTVHVGPGPTLPIPLWNASPTSVPGFVSIHGTVTPDTAFVFLNESNTYNFSWGAWAPVPAGGIINYNVPVGNYSGEVLLANHDRMTLSLPSSPTGWTVAVSLNYDASQGYYTPIMAFDNTQLSEFASSGSGTAVDPYIITQTTPALLDPAFGSLNDFDFPVFPGLLFAHTTAYVVIQNGPTFPIDYAGRVLTHLTALGLPDNNSLQYQLYGTDHVTIWNTTGISGWFDGSNLAGFPITSLMVWNSTNTLIGDNQFWDDGTSILLYGGTGNTVWGNWFSEGPVAQDPNYNFAVMAGTYAIGPQVYESGDLIFNNAFLTTIPAYSPASTIYYETFYSGFNQSWINDWNVPAQPASDVMVVNGINLTGSITGGIFQGGNLWWNYGEYGTYLPFDGYGLIAVGGDYAPLVGDQVTFAATGLPAGTVWGVTILGMDITTAGSSVTFALYDGSFPYTVDGVNGYYNQPGSGTLTLLQAPATVVVAYTFAGTWVTTFTETGLPAGTVWGIYFEGSQLNTNSSLVLNLGNGTYTWVAVPVAGMYVNPSWGTFYVNGDGSTINLAFTPIPASLYEVRFVATGLPSGTAWSVVVAGSTWSGTTDVLSGTEANGSYDYTVGSVAAYTASPLNGTVSVNGATVTVAIAWTPMDGSIVGTVTPATASVFVDGAAVTVAANGSFDASLAPGVHAIVASSTGYLTHFDNVSVSAGAIKLVAIGLTAIPSGGGSGSNTTGLTSSDLALVGGLALVAVLFLIGMVYFWSKARRPPVMMKPESDSGSIGNSPKS